MAESQMFKNLLFGLVKQAKSDIERRFAQAKITITPFEYGIIALAKHKPMTMADVAKKLGIKAPSLVPYIDALEKKQLLQRKADKLDRRKIELHVTSKGQKLLTHIMKDHPKDILNQAFHKLTKSQQTQLIVLLEHLSKSLKN